VLFNNNVSMDELDVKALKHLMKSGRASWSELSEILGLSGPAVAERVRKLEEAGVIRGYTALLDPAHVGCALTAFVFVTLEHPRHRAGFLEKLAELPGVLECHHITGDHDYLLKVRCATTAELEHIISAQLKEVAGVAKTMTLVALSTVKETAELPIANRIASEPMGR
jgi:Lrp/AsnC family leucine-responsive transcriptional regulator